MGSRPDGFLICEFARGHAKITPQPYRRPEGLLVPETLIPPAPQRFDIGLKSIARLQTNDPIVGLTPQWSDLELISFASFGTE